MFSDYEIIMVILGMIGLGVYNKYESNRTNRNIENVENWYAQRQKKDEICKLDEEIKELKKTLSASAVEVTELKGKITLLEALLLKETNRRKR